MPSALADELGQRGNDVEDEPAAGHGGVGVLMQRGESDLTLGAHGGVARTDPHPPAATGCSAVERVGVGLDLGLPLIKTGTRDHCDTTASTTGQVLTAAGWGLQLLAWAFATLLGRW